MKYFLLHTVLFIPFVTISQPNNLAVAKVSYTLKYMQDTSFKNNFREEQFLLFVGNSFTHYFSYEKYLQDSIAKKQMEKQLKDGFDNVVIGNSKRYTPIELYYDISNKSLFVQNSILKKYLYNDSCHIINWHITDERKKFDKYNCTKAVGTFRGRDYIAWFTNEIPIPAGPWKLNGLPGLILEAYDTQNQVQFLFNGIESITNQSISLRPNLTEVIEVSKKDFIALQKIVTSDPIGYLNANSNFKMNPNLKPIRSLKKAPNPVELTEN